MKSKWIIVFLLVLSFIVSAPVVYAQKVDARAVVQGNNRFAFDMYKQLSVEKKGQNMFFSPFSISTALAMTYAAARGQTEKEMAQVLHYPYPQANAHKPFCDIITDLNNRAKKGNYQLNVANRIWIQQGQQPKAEFAKVIQSCYQGGFEGLSFTGNPEGSRKTINTWVEKKTNRKIKDLIPPGAVTGDTRMVLTNAIYFKGNWVSAFKETNTKPMPFTKLDGKKATTKFMYQNHSFPYMETPDYQAILLPYNPKGAKELGMVVVLPKKVNGLPVVEKKLTVAEFEKIRKSLANTEIDVYLPKFRMTTNFSLVDVMKKMGMKVPFGGGADFTGSGLSLFISGIFHKAFVDVNEKGTEAAAATAVVMTTESVEMPPPVFKADHPFTFFIVDQKTGSILFMGRMMQPEK